MLKRVREYFGFIKQESVDTKYPSTLAIKDNLDLKLDYLKSLEGHENSRQSAIETKTSQLIGQTGIIFSLLSLFIGNYLSKFNGWPWIFQILLLFLFLVALFFYLVTIFQATKYMNIKKYRYGQRSTKTVESKFATKEDFQLEEIKDLIFSIERNKLVNNQKIDNLIYGYRSFRLGTIMVGILSIVLIVSGYFEHKVEVNSVKLDGPIEIQGIDTVLQNLGSKINAQKIKVVIVHDTAAKH